MQSATVRAEPETVTRFGKSHDHGIRGSGRGIDPIESVLFKSAESGLGSDPEHASPVFQDGSDDVAWQARGGAERGESPVLISDESTATCSHP
jgi:hypothetical protein